MRDVSMLERVALRDHEAMDEIRRTYKETVQRIAESVLGGQRRSLVPEVVGAVWQDLWNHAYLYDAERSDAAGWIRKITMETALIYVHGLAGVDSAPDNYAPDAGHDKERRTEFAELLSMVAKPGAMPDIPDREPVPDLCSALRLLPIMDRGILLRRYAYRENLDRMAEVSGVTREVIADRLRLARTRLSMMWSPAAAAESSWEALDPDLLSDCVPDAPLSYGNEAAGSSGESGGGFGKLSPSTSKRRIHPVTIAAAVLVTVAAFVIGTGMSPKILKGLRPEPSVIPTGPIATHTYTVPPDVLSSHFGSKASIMNMVYFDWSNISSVAVVRSGSNMLRKSRTLREPADLDRLYTLITDSSYVFSNSTDDPVAGPEYYELQVNAEGFHSLLFYPGADGKLLVSGNFHSEWFNLEDHVVLKSLDTSFTEFTQKMDTLTALFG